MLFELARPILHSMPPEIAHNMSLAFLKNAICLLPKANIHIDEHYELLGLHFPNRVGIAAGFDKNAIAIEALFHIGFGFVEIGTVTPKPQIGNPQPRLFRLKEDKAIINRMGFNNDGVDIVKTRLEAIKEKNLKGIIGANIGANKDSEDKIADYALCFESLYGLADYFTLNVSSPNTQGLRDLQAKESLEKLFDDILNIRAKKSSDNTPPIFLKIAPDLNDSQIEDICQTLLIKKIDGIIATNTTIDRSSLMSKHKTETGGLSGKPIFDMSTNILKQCRQILGNDFPIIGVGGITDYITAKEKFDAGANLIQAYAGFVYHGTDLLNDMRRAAK